MIFFGVAIDLDAFLCIVSAPLAAFRASRQELISRSKAPCLYNTNVYAPGERHSCIANASQGTRSVNLASNRAARQDLVDNALRTSSWNKIRTSLARHSSHHVTPLATWRRDPETPKDSKHLRLHNVSLAIHNLSRSLCPSPQLGIVSPDRANDH